MDDIAAGDAAAADAAAASVDETAPATDEGANGAQSVELTIRIIGLYCSISIYAGIDKQARK